MHKRTITGKTNPKNSEKAFELTGGYEMGKRFDLEDDRNRKSMRDRRIGKKKMNREKITMLAAAVTVLGALTFTGVYLGSRGNHEDGQQRIDFSSLEDSAREQERQEQNQAQQNNDKSQGNVAEHNDMDVDPELYAQYKEANSGDVVNPGLESAQNTDKAEAETEAEDNSVKDSGEADASDSMSYLSEQELEALEDSQETTAGMSSEEIVESKIETAAQTLWFDENEVLSWPVVGNVLINYSMDGYVYFTTLGQYRYSPAIVISAAQGQSITSASDGIVSDVFYNEEIGNAVTVTLGNGYELTYGQLTDIAVKKGDYVNVGDLIGNVAPPTKYYALEGSNVYFAMTKDGEPVNPLTLLK